MATSTGTIAIVWDNGEDEFCIAKVGSILSLEEKCNAGIAEILRRLETGTWRLNDVRETIRFGLIGGGMTPDKAMMAVNLHVHGQPLAKSVMIAHAVIAAALVGVPDDPVGKKTASEAKTRAKNSSTKTVASDALQSSELEQL